MAPVVDHAKAEARYSSAGDATCEGGVAQLIRMGWFRPVHAKSMGSQEVRALLVARKQLLGRLM
jgi:hypothetical protein